MPEKAAPGCALELWIMVAAIVAGILALVIGSHAPVMTPSTASSPTTSPSSPVLTSTVIPQETDAYFMVENNLISFTHFPTLGQPCYYLISGRVLDLKAEPFTDFVVNIKMIDIEGVAPEEIVYAFPGDGAFSEDGPSGWATMLPQWQVSYEIWLTTDRAGKELSHHIVIPAQDCDHNRAIVNFVQVKSVP